MYIHVPICALHKVILSGAAHINVTSISGISIAGYESDGFTNNTYFEVLQVLCYIMKLIVYKYK